MTEYLKIKNWILQQQEKLDFIIRDAAESYYQNYSNERNFKYDTNSTINELYLLSKGDDLCYDRPSIGFTYSLWYHGKRINGLFDFFINLLLESKNEQVIEIFDLGAGTGAIQWVIGLVYESMKINDVSVPRIKIINIDSSPFMLEYNKNYLWNKFTDNYINCKNIEIEYEINTWTNTQQADFSNVWLCASYLFDHSENQALIAEVFRELVEKYQPQKILLLSSWSKQALVDSVGSLITGSGFNTKRGTFSRELFTGTLTEVNGLRNKLNSEGFNFSGICKWNIDTWYGKILERTQTSLGIGFPNKLEIYQSAERNRTKIRLTSEQEKASEESMKPTIIIGPAGCGKSVVLTEKVKKIVDKNEYSPSLNILLTTFNKDLVQYLGDWLFDILEDKTKFRRTYDSWNGIRSQHSYFIFEGSDRPNITVMHFDVLPTKIGGLRAYKTTPDYENYESFHNRTMQSAIDSYVNEYGINLSKYSSILNPEFLLDEYHRVIYGLQCTTPNAYLIVARDGRGIYPRLTIKGKRRQVVSGCLKRYKKSLDSSNYESYIIRRRRFLNKLNKGQGRAGEFTHILVDELQDCCKADYDIFYSLLNDNNNLTVAGDLAQSINIGTVARIPRPTDKKMENFQRIYLEGSFRLPFRISECIRSLSKKIKDKFNSTGNTDIYEIIPYKGAPPGARPIVIMGKSEETLAIKIKEIYDAYKSYDPTQINSVSIFEKNNKLSREINNKEIRVYNSSVQKVKGMEMPFVIWSTMSQVDKKQEVDQFIYTILTRTTNILVIAIQTSMLIAYFEIIKNFEKNRLIFWDEQSEKIYNSISERKFDDDILDSEDDEETLSVQEDEEEII